MKQGQQNNPFDILDCIDLDPSQRSSSEQMDQPHGLDPVQPPPKRPSFKNRYINKLKDSLQDRSSSPKQLLSSQEELSSRSEEASRKLRNRVAAKESRDRKKQYVEMMEQETMALEEELNRVYKELDDCREQIMRTTFAAGQRVGSSFTSKINHVSKKLRKLITEEQSQERNNQINMAVDSLSYRYAGLGKERKMSTNECYRQIINLAMPITDRYMLWVSMQGCHISTSETDHPEEEWFRETRQILGPVAGGERAQEVCRRIKEERGEIFGLIRKLGEARKRMEGLCQGLDDCLLSIRETFTPLQLAQFMVADETYRYREELRYHQKLWEGEEEDPKPRKIHKGDSRIECEKDDSRQQFQQ